MAIEAAVQLLTTALLLLQLVTANPSLPQSMRDTAQTVAQNAINEATRALGTPTPSMVAPTPTVTTTPSAGIAPTIHAFTASPSVVSAGQAVTLSWSSNAANCHLFHDNFNVTPQVGSASTFVVYPTASKTYKLSCFYGIDASTGKDGSSSQRTVYVSVGEQVTPTLSASVSPSSIIAGQSASISWSSSNANSCTIQSQSQYEPWTENVGLSGSKSVKPSQTTSYRLLCLNDLGNGKDGPSVDKTLTVNVSYPTMSYNGSEAVQVNIPTLYTNPDKPFTITGSVSPSVAPITIVLVDVAYNGSTDWGSVSQLLKGGSGVRAVSKAASVSSDTWSASFGGLPEGWYHIYIYDAASNLKGSGFFVSTWKG